MSIFSQLFFDYTLRTVILGTCILGLVSGGLGCFAVLKKQSLLGDAISHAALPGIAIAFLLTESKHPLVLLIGAMLAGWVGTIIMGLITEYTALKKDSALGIVLSTFFGFGLVLLTLIQRMPTASKSGLNKFLFGNAATLLHQDVVVMGVLGMIVFLITLSFWKEFKLITFDPDYASCLGFPRKRLDFLLTTLIVVAIVIGLQTVGVVLMSAMVIAPAASARQWTDRLGKMVILASFFGAISGMIGSLISSSVSKCPTGPTIVLVMSCIVVVSLLFAPNRGLLWGWVRQKKNRKQIKENTLLRNLWLLSSSHKNPTHPHDLSVLKSVGGSGLMHRMQGLENLGFVYSPDQGFWGLTIEGVAYANTMFKDEGNQ